MATFNYQSGIEFEPVTVMEVGAVGARVKTNYNAEINIRWGTNLPSPVPRVGEMWLAAKIGPGVWRFENVISADSYNFMRYAMRLDIRSCIGGERAVIDDIATVGVGEVYLTVARDGIVYWDSSVAGRCGLSVVSGVNNGGRDYVRRVVDRCRAAGLTVVLVIDMELWSDPGNVRANYYQQMVADESYAGFGWGAVFNYDWDELQQLTWAQVENSEFGSAVGSYAPKWSLVTAKPVVADMVAELYSEFGDAVRGVCFDNWAFAGALADVGDYVAGEFKSRTGLPLTSKMLGGMFSDEWWENRREIMDFFNDLQTEFVGACRAAAPTWQVTAIVPERVLCITSERTGRFDTWVDDSFGGFGWSMVGCKMDFTRSPDADAEERSFEFEVASLRRLARGASPLYEIDVDGIGGEYSGMLNILAKYDATNVLVSDYESWRRMDDARAIRLRNALNSYSVVKRSEYRDVGLLVSNNTRDVSFANDFVLNRFTRSIQTFSKMLLDKTPHRIRVLFDGDMEDIESVSGISSVVLFDAINMSDDAVDAVSSLIDSGAFGVVLIGLNGLRGELSSQTRRADMPFLDKFGDVDFGQRMYDVELFVKPGWIDVAPRVYAIYEAESGAVPVKASASIATSFSGGSSVPAPVYSRGRSAMIALELLDNPTLMDFASDAVLYSIGVG